MCSIPVSNFYLGPSELRQFAIQSLEGTALLPKDFVAVFETN